MIIETCIRNNEPIIYLINRKGEKREYNTVKGFIPYFYILKDEVVPMGMKEIRKVENCNIKGLFGEDLKRVYTYSSSQISQIRDKFKKHYEADVPYATRYCVDVLKQIPAGDLRIWYMDIETDDSLDVTGLTKPITLIGLWDNFSKKYFVYTWREDFSKNKTNTTEAECFFFSSEKDMIDAFLNSLAEKDPDIITAWNMHRFDLRYVINRMRKLGMNDKRLSPFGELNLGDENISIKGRVILDLMECYKHLIDTEIESSKLDDIGELELGLKKIKLDKTVGQLWRENIDKLIEYNIRDIDILKKIDEKIKIIPFMDDLRRLTNCRFEDVWFQSMLFDGYLLTKYNGLVVFPSKSRTEEKFRAQGATVINPKKGVHLNVANIDLKSLYPSIIISLNMSPETYDMNGDVDIGNGVKFSFNKVGVIPSLLKELMIMRDDKRKLEKINKGTTLGEEITRQQNAIKRIMNAIYGQTLSDKSRIYFPKMGDSVLYVGRSILEYTIKFLEGKGCEVIYGDTDGLFFKYAEGTNVEEIINQVNDSYGEFVKRFGIKEHIFQIKLETIYRKLILSTRKRYAGYDENGTFIVKGMEAKRTDSSRYSRGLQKHILIMILDGESKEEVKKYLSFEITKIKCGMIALEDIAIPRGMTRNPHLYEITSPHKRGCMYSNQYLKMNFKENDKVRLLYIKQAPVGYPSTKEVCINYSGDLPSGFVIDWDKMIEKCVIMKLDKLFEIVNWNVMEVLNSGKSLLDF